LDSDGSLESFENAQIKYFGADSNLLRSEGGPEDEEILRVRERLLLRYLPRGAKVVEVGPGAGHILQFLKKRGFSVSAVEHSPALAQGVARKLGVPVVVSEWETADLPAGSFDAVCSFHVIEHVKDPLAHMTKAFQAVRRDGFAFVATPNARSWQHLMVETLSPNFDSAHRFVFSRRSLTHCCEKAGWEVVATFTPEISSNWARVLTKALRRFRDEDEEATAGRYSGGGQRFRFLYRSFQVLTGPLRLVQRLSGYGNEVFLVLRKP
jgi:2-polyprenyl-3-methyl-5-hydroxy-6-metoxy-1,4-benzoquinol methylase